MNVHQLLEAHSALSKMQLELEEQIDKVTGPLERFAYDYLERCKAVDRRYVDPRCCRAGYLIYDGHGNGNVLFDCSCSWHGERCAAERLQIPYDVFPIEMGVKVP